MSMKIGKDFLMRNLKIGENEVLINEKDSLYCQFDEILIHQKSQAYVEIVFLFKEQHVNKMLLSCDFSTGSTLTLRGFTGKMEVSFEGVGETEVFNEAKSFWIYTPDPFEKGWYPVKVFIDEELVPTSAYWDGTEWNRSCVLVHGERCAAQHLAKDLANKNC